MKLDLHLIPYTKINSQCIKDLSVRTKTIKLLEESRGVNPCDLRLANSFLYMTPKTQATEEKMDQMDIIKSKHFCD